MKIVYCLDENYKKYAEKSILSVLKYNPKADITIVSVLPMNVMGLKNITIPLYGDFRRRGVGDRITQTAYLKLFLTMLPNDYSKVIFLDGDIICHKPLNDLWNMDCKYINVCESHNYGKKQAQELGLEKYANTGVMVMNLDNLRRIDFTKKCVLVQNMQLNTLWCHDETCINVAMSDKLNFIPQVFNACVNREYDEQILSKDVYLSHYIGKHKESMLDLGNYEYMPNIHNLIRGRSVAIVGNASSIFDRTYGKKIDEYDVVIRFNRGFISRPSSQGSRTTILFVGTDMDKAETNKFDNPIVICRSSHYMTPSNYVIGKERGQLKEIIGSQPSTGFMAIDMCLSMGAGKISLFGFDFEKTPTFYNPVGYKTRHDYSTEQALVSEYRKAGLIK